MEVRQLLRHSYWYFPTWYCICCYCSYIYILTRGLRTPEGPSKGKYTQTRAWCSRTDLIGPCRSSMNEPQSFSCVKQACLIFLLPNLSAQCSICWQKKTKVKDNFYVEMNYNPMNNCKCWNSKICSIIINNDLWHV